MGCDGPFDEVFSDPNSALLLDRLCDRFETACQSGDSPRLEDYLASVPRSCRDAALGELLVLELDYRRARAETPAPDEYRARFPESGHVVGGAFERASRRNHQSKSALAAPGPKLSDGALQVRCANCHEPVETDPSTSWTDIVCPACGSSFSLVAQETMAYARGDRVLGHFELIEQVGIGCFGSVWKARDTKLERQVALKIPRQGQLDSQQTDLFLRDARAAARLNHPNIVGVHEVGRQDDTLYIVSDYIEGANLKEWLSGQRLTLREAAELVVKISHALHHAHESGVVHRDLKPGNVMMDLAGEPHVIDFGLARRTAEDVTLTLEGQVLGTPAYMSPEQARGEGHRADRRADIYSLGVILFELLTGELPFRGDARMLVVQILREDAPSPRKLNARIPRDLETITLKCLQKDFARRYQTAGELAEDLERFLSGRPIQARPVGRAERGWQWCRRNRAVASLGTAVLLLLIGGTGVSAYYALEADARAREAESERARTLQAFRKARQAVDDSFTVISENQLIDAPGLQPLRMELLQSSLKYYEGFMTDLADDLSVRAELAAAYRRVGNVRRTMGELSEAESLFAQAIEIDEKLVQENPSVAPYQSDLAGAYHALAVVHSDSGRLTQAEGLYARAIEFDEQLVRENPAVAQYQTDLAAACHGLAVLLGGVGRLTEAEAANAKALELRQNLAGENPALPVYQSELADSYTHRGYLRVPHTPGEYLQRHDPARVAEAEQAYEKAVEIQAQLARENPGVLEYQHDLALSYTNLGNLQRIAGRRAEAEAFYDQAVEIQKKLARENPTVLGYQHELALSYTNLGNLQRIAGQLAEANASYDQAVEIQKKLAWENPSVPEYQMYLAWGYNHLAAVQHLAGRDADADQIYRQAIARWESPELSPADAEVANHARAVLYAQLAKQNALAGGDWQRTAEAIAKAGSLAPDEAFVQAACGDAAALAGRWAEAAACYGRADDATEHGWHMMALHGMLELAAGNHDAYLAICRDLVKRHEQNEMQNAVLAIVLTCALGRGAVGNAEPVLQMARKIVDADPYNPMPKVGLGAMLYQAGRTAEAAEILAATVPLHTVAALVVPDKQEALLQSQLLAEVNLAWAYYDLGKRDEAARAQARAEKLLARIEKTTPRYDEGQVLWGPRYAVHITKRELANLSGVTETKSDSQPAGTSGAASAQ